MVPNSYFQVSKQSGPVSISTLSGLDPVLLSAGAVLTTSLSVSSSTRRASSTWSISLGCTTGTPARTPDRPSATCAGRRCQASPPTACPAKVLQLAAPSAGAPVSATRCASRLIDGPSNACVTVRDLQALIRGWGRFHVSYHQSS